jgi:Iron-containing redox enzyme
MASPDMHPDTAPRSTDATSQGPLSAHPLGGAMAFALEGRELLGHPFYLRWQAGELAPGELAEYAVHYRAFEAALPVVLAAVVDRLRVEGEVEAAATVGQNLSDELGRPEAHLALFDRFAGALGSPSTSTAPGPAAQALVATYADLVADGPVATLAGLAAYETQASAIAATKGDGLRRWYGMDSAGTEFWPCSVPTPTRSPWRLGAPPTHGGPSSTSERPRHRSGPEAPSGPPARRWPTTGLSPVRYRPPRRTTPSRPGSPPGCG